MSFLGYVLLFGAGVSTIAAPCVLPLLPAYATVVLEAGARGGRAAVAGAGLRFIGGFTMVFVALGTAAGGIGAVPGRQVWVELLAAFLLAGLGLSMLLRPQGRHGWRTVRLVPPLAVLGAGTRWRPFAVGAAFGATWSPCVGPLLGAALTTAGAGADPLLGAGFLAAYSAGLAVPFLAFCLAAAAAGGVTPGTAWLTGRHAVAAQRVIGGAVLLMAVLLATGRPGWAAFLTAGG